MTRNEYIAKVLVGCRGELEATLTSLGLGPNDPNAVTLGLISKTLDNVANQVRGRTVLDPLTVSLQKLKDSYGGGGGSGVKVMEKV